MSVRNELQSIISGNTEDSHAQTMQASTRYLQRKKAASAEPEESKFVPQKVEPTLKDIFVLSQLANIRNVPSVSAANQTLSIFL